MAYTLEKFLFCLELQLGGIICGWWGMIGSAISIIGLILGLIFGEKYFDNFLPVSFGHGGTILSVVIGIIIFVIYFYFSYQLLLGSQNGNSSQMFGYLIIHSIVVILLIISIFKNAASLLVVIIYVYLWFCIYSLYVRSGGSAIV